MRIKIFYFSPPYRKVMSQSVTIVTLFIKEVTPMSNNSEIMVHLFNGILYSNENK